MPQQTEFTLNRGSDLQSGGWREWWRLRPKWLRILCWATLSFVTLLILLAFRVAIGLNEADEITRLRSRGAKIGYFWDSMELIPIAPPESLRRPYIKFRQFYKQGVAGTFGLSSANVNSIRLEGATDDDLRLIGQRFKNVEYLSLSRSTLTTTGISSLAECHQIRNLDLDRCDLDDQAIKPLELLTRLERLNLDYALITDESLSTFERMQSLNNLRLTDTNASADGIRAWRAKLAKSVPKIEGGDDEFPNSLLGTIRWSDGSRSAYFGGEWQTIKEGPIGSPSCQTYDTSWHHLGRNDISFPASSPMEDGDYQWTLTLSGYPSDPVKFHVKDGQPTTRLIEFRMPVTKAEALEKSGGAAKKP